MQLTKHDIESHPPEVLQKKCYEYCASALRNGDFDRKQISLDTNVARLASMHAAKTFNQSTQEKTLVIGHIQPFVGEGIKKAQWATNLGHRNAEHLANAVEIGFRKAETPSDMRALANLGFKNGYKQNGLPFGEYNRLQKAIRDVNKAVIMTDGDMKSPEMTKALSRFTSIGQKIAKFDEQFPSSNTRHLATANAIIAGLQNKISGPALREAQSHLTKGYKSVANHYNQQGDQGRGKLEYTPPWHKKRYGEGSLDKQDLSSKIEALNTKLSRDTHSISEAKKETSKEMAFRVPTWR